MSSTGSGKSLLHNIFHRLIGARGSSGAFQLPNYAQHDASGSSSLPQQQPQRQPYFISDQKPANFGQFYKENPAQEIAQHKVVFFGEIHSKPPIIAFQRVVQEEMAQTAPTLHVVLEHFSFEMQSLLDDYQNGDVSFDELNENYHEIGTESHNLEPYRALLEDAKQCKSRIKLHAGFLSRHYARMLMKEGEDKVLQEAAAWLPPYDQAKEQLQGSEQHYNIFENLLTGRPTFSDQKPDDRFRKIFQAQLLKDVAMSHKVNTLIDEASKQQGNNNNYSKDDKLLILAGNGHVLGYSGVPERVLQQHPELEAKTCVIASCNAESFPVDHQTLSSRNGDDNILHGLEEAFGPAGTNPADYVYLYQDAPEYSDSEAGDEVKNETRHAYDRVGESARYKGNMAKALAIMRAMGYTEEQTDVAGDDAYNFQGVGNPHIHASIQPGEVVLDVGSGLGLDSFIAHNAATQGGRHGGFVIGIDFSSKEVSHAQSCARRRKLDKIRFAAADMEQIPLPDDSVDVVISNGAFCLAPNKEKAFAEVFRVLKPGGRISICTTATRDKSKLEPGVSWPICMQMFVPMNDIQPMCARIGFEKISIDDSDSSMSMELPEEVLNENDNPNAEKRNKVHVGKAEFSHLENYDMDALCARVCIVARKPSKLQ